MFTWVNKERLDFVILQKVDCLGRRGFPGHSSQHATVKGRNLCHVSSAIYPTLFFFKILLLLFFFCSQHVFDYILTIVSMWLFLRCDLNLGLYTLSHIDCVFAFVWTVCWFASPIQTLAKCKPQIDPPKCGSNEVVQFKQMLDFRLDGRNAGFLGIMLTSFPSKLTSWC